MVLEVVLGFFWLAIFAIVVSKGDSYVLLDVEPFKNHYWSSDVVLYSFYSFGVAVFFYKVQKWNRLFRDYLMEKERILAKMWSKQIHIFEET